MSKLVVEQHLQDLSTDGIFFEIMDSIFLLYAN